MQNAFSPVLRLYNNNSSNITHKSKLKVSLPRIKMSYKINREVNISNIKGHRGNTSIPNGDRWNDVRETVTQSQDQNRRGQTVIPELHVCHLRDVWNQLEFQHIWAALSPYLCCESLMASLLLAGSTQCLQLSVFLVFTACLDL